jgi:hypothetical protein
MSQRTRVAFVGGFVLFATIALFAQAALIDRQPAVRQDASGGLYDGQGNGTTLVAAQSWNDEGQLVEVGPNGTVRWSYSVDNARFFGIHPLRAGEEAPSITPKTDGNVVLFTVAEVLPAAECEERYIDEEQAFRGGRDAAQHCVQNRVLLMDRSEKEIVWEYNWFDEIVHYHEVHDAEVTDDGEVAIIDMGNNRAFTVNADGEITWEWQAEPHIGEGTAFFEEHVPPGGADEFANGGEFDDWTHMNDIDELPNGNFQLSIRNYDMIIEVAPDTGEIVDSIGEPGMDSLMSRQHNPQPLPKHGSTIVADSENDRVIQVDNSAEEIEWAYSGPRGDPLQWPRDADRLPNGNTLITDSRNNRILEINASGEVVWTFDDPDGKVIPLPYEAERLPVGEASGGPPTGELWAQGPADHGFAAILREVETIAHWVLPTWMHLPQQLNLLGILLGAFWLVGEGVLYGWRQIQTGGG